KEIIEEIVEEYKGKECVQGIMLFGSHVLGLETPESDVDIYVFVDKEENAKDTRQLIQGTEVGLTFFTIPTAARKMVEAQSRALLRNLMEGKVLYSVDDRIVLLQELARRVKRRPKREEWIILKRKRMSHFLESTERLVREGKEILALYTMNFAFNEAIRLFYALQQWRPAKRTYIMRELKESDKPLYDLVKQFLHEYNVEAKYNIFYRIITHIIDPHGGFLPKRWKVPLRYSHLTRPFNPAISPIPSFDFEYEEVSQALDEYGKNMVPIVPEAGVQL
ncbi:nucleotidyltransferase domain-containing protein, partial [bacterium]|nr:nucleotidyltransferase domain-containing protein [bacterium]